MQQGLFSKSWPRHQYYTICTSASSPDSEVHDESSEEKRSESESGPLSHNYITTTQLRYILERKNCGQKNDGNAGSPCLDKARLVQGGRGLWAMVNGHDLVGWSYAQWLRVIDWVTVGIENIAHGSPNTQPWGQCRRVHGKTAEEGDTKRHDDHIGCGCGGSTSNRHPISEEGTFLKGRLLHYKAARSMSELQAIVPKKRTSGPSKEVATSEEPG